jgi:O-antigen biosynthesis protein
MFQRFFHELKRIRSIAPNCKSWLQHKLYKGPIQKQRLLFIDARLPLPWYGAGFSRANAIVRFLNDRGWDVTCFSVGKNNVPTDTVRTDLPAPIKIIKRGRPTRLMRILFGSETTLRRFLFGRTFAYDVALVSRHAIIKITADILKRLKTKNKNCKIIFDFEALPALGERSRQALECGSTAAEAEARIREQIADVAWVDAVICNSRRDAQELQRLGRPDAISVSYLENPSPTESDFSDRKNLLFVGRLVEKRSPNVEGLLWFVHEVWPAITARLGSKVHLVVAGIATAPDIRSLACDSIKILGVVHDLRNLYDHARVFVAPNLVSYGTPIKVLEAAAYGVPIVTTDEVNSYLGWCKGFDILCSDEPAAFAEACIQLYEDKKLWCNVRRQALHRIDPQGDQERFLSLLSRLQANEVRNQ